ncbi:MAG: uncharacterized protein JWR66_1433 [Modestobacter sp.]|nr:uncharacterized protein [Modestobacter sp.]
MGGGETTSTFAGPPQPVEIHHRGLWYSGELTGWRHEGNGRVTARVRCVVDGLRHSTWKDLSELRLPDPANPPRRERFPAMVRQPAAVVPDDADRTRPHALLVGAPGRPAKPEHAVRPPAGTPVPRHGEPVHSSPESSVPGRPGDEPHRRRAQLSVA